MKQEVKKLIVLINYEAKKLIIRLTSNLFNGYSPSFVFTREDVITAPNWPNLLNWRLDQKLIFWQHTPILSLVTTEKLLQVFPCIPLFFFLLEEIYCLSLSLSLQEKLLGLINNYFPLNTYWDIDSNSSTKKKKMYTYTAVLPFLYLKW